jgi:hypothetical protein
MSKYEEAVKTKQLCKKLINDFKNQNPTPKDRDKTGLRWRFSGIKKNENLFKEMLLIPICTTVIMAVAAVLMMAAKKRGK